MRRTHHVDYCLRLPRAKSADVLRQLVVVGEWFPFSIVVAKYHPNWPVPREPGLVAEPSRRRRRPGLPKWLAAVANDRLRRVSRNLPVLEYSTL